MRGTTLPSAPSLPGFHDESGAVAHAAAAAAYVRARRIEAVDDSAVWERWSALEEAGHRHGFPVPHLRRAVDPQAGAGSRPPRFVVEVADRSGPILAAAFTLHWRRGITVVELADCGLSDYAAPERAVLAALPPHDVLVLRKMREQICGHANPFAHFAGARSMWTGTLAVDPVEALAAGGGAVKESKRKARKIVREGGRVRRIADRAEALAAMESLFAFRAARAAKVGGQLNHPAVRDFYREVIGRGLGTGFAVVHEIAAADRLLGVVQGFVYRGRFHGTLMGFAADDPASAAVSPGLAGVVHALADHAETGGTVFDFGPGEHPYKARFGGIAADYGQVTRAATIRGLVPLALDFARCEGRRVLRGRPALAARVRRWRGR